MQGWLDKTDDTLLEHIGQGSHQAFRVLVERHTMRFFRLAFRYVAERTAAEDMVQRAFLKLWEKPERWDASKGVKFTTWFSRIIINQSLDLQKKHKPLALPDHIELVDDRAGQEARLIQAQQQRVLELAIQKLPMRQQTALNLCFYEEETNKHAAEVMQISVGAVESLLMRAKANLREALGKPEQRRAVI